MCIRDRLIALTAALAAFFWSTAIAGPPKGMIQKMTPIHTMCLQADVDPNHLVTLIGALIEDYGVNISMTFSADAAKTKRIAIIENPDTDMVGVMMNTDQETCIAFSGQDRKVFVRPADHPTGALNEDQGT